LWEAGHIPVTSRHHLASYYARQAHDRELEVMTKRIQARAYDRMGELLKAISPKAEPPAKGQNRGNASPIPSRAEVACDAGISPDQMKNAIRVNNIPRDTFEEQGVGKTPG
jgi:hypothetical protein